MVIKITWHEVQLEQFAYGGEGCIGWQNIGKLQHPGLGVVVTGPIWNIQQQFGVAAEFIWLITGVGHNPQQLGGTIDDDEDTIELDIATNESCCDARCKIGCKLPEFVLFVKQAEQTLQLPQVWDAATAIKTPPQIEHTPTTAGE